MLGVLFSWLKTFFTKTRLNVLLFLWLTLFSCILMVISAACIFLSVRYWWLPTHEVQLPVDFVTKAVKSSSASADRRELIAIVNLEEVGSLVPLDYSIDITLKMPKSAANRQAGNFALRGILSNKPWRTDIAGDVMNLSQDRTEKMCLFPFQSDEVRLIESIAFAPLYILGLKEESATLHVRLWEYARNPLKNRPYLLVLLDKPVWISNAHLTFTARLQGVSYLLRAYPVSTFILGTTFICEVELLSAALALLWYGLKSTRDQVRDKSRLGYFVEDSRGATARNHAPVIATGRPRTTPSTADRKPSTSSIFDEEDMWIPEWFSKDNEEKTSRSNSAASAARTNRPGATTDGASSFDNQNEEAGSTARSESSTARGYRPISPAPSP